MRGFFFIKFCVLCCFLAVGCRSSQPISSSVSKDSIVYVHDSVLSIDSVFIKETEKIEVKGDTVFVDRFKYQNRYIFLDRWHDSIKIVSDTVQITKTATIEKQLSKWQQGLMTLGAISLMIIVIFLIVLIVRLKK